jgi:DNA polymerase-3 subunit alpha
VNEFTDLHHHSEMSLLDGYGSIRKHVQRAKELGHAAVVLTEHGSIRGWQALASECASEKIRPGFGCEFYVTKDHRRRGLTDEQRDSVTAGKSGDDARAAVAALEAMLGVKDRRHLVLVAMNDVGVRNIIALNNAAHRDGLYYKPRIDLELLAKHSEGVFGSSACMGGVLAQPLLQGDFDEALDTAEDLATILDGRFYGEIQPHPLKSIRAVNIQIVRICRALGIPLIATNDAHYVTPDDWDVHDALLAVGHGKLISDTERIRYHPESFCLRDREGMERCFESYHRDLDWDAVQEGLDNAASLGEDVGGSLPAPPPGRVFLPALAADPDAELALLCQQGWDGLRSIDARASRNGCGTDGRGDQEVDYTTRLTYELKTIRDRGFAPYFLLVRDVIGWCRSHGIAVGPGRGSSAGSLVCYLLGITAIDPLEHKLMFERFLDPARPDWPDIDIDVDGRHRSRVVRYLQEKYGERRVALVGTVNRMRGRTALRDIGRAYDVPYSEVNSVSSAIVGDVVRGDEGDEGTIKDALASVPAFSDFAGRYPDAMRAMLELEGHVRHVGIHAAGVVVSPHDLDDALPLELRKSRGESVIVTAFDMRDVERAGYVKLDLLGLNTMAVINEALEIADRRTGWRPDLEDLTYDDPEVLQAFTDGDFIGVFQFDSPSARAACAGVEFHTFDDIVAMNAINRPGPANAGLADVWRDRRAGRPTKRLPAAVEDLCSDALGVMVYQEHVIKVLREVAGFDHVMASKVRRAIAKSKGREAIDEFEEDFVAGAKKAMGGEPAARALWAQIGEFGRYAFNRSHAAAYGAIAYWCQWLKLNLPVEFFTALIANQPDTDRASRLVRAAARRGIRIEPPSVNTSHVRWRAERGAVWTGLSMIKGVGDNAAAELERCAPYTDIVDLLMRVDRRRVHKGVLVALVKAGALREVTPHSTTSLLYALESGALLKAAKRKKDPLLHVQACLDEAAAATVPASDEDLWAMQLQVGIPGSGKHPLGVLNGVDLEFLASGWASLDDVADGDRVRGVISACKVGSGDGGKWARLELEDIHGTRLTMRLNAEDHAKNHLVLDEGVGALVACRVRVTQNGNVYCDYMVDLLALREKLVGRSRADFSSESWPEDIELSEWERTLIRGAHPAGDEEPVWRAKTWNRVLVTSAKDRTDSMGGRMCFARVEGGQGPSYELVVFSSVRRGNRLIPGEIREIRAKWQKSSGSLIAEGIRKVKP